METNGQVQVFLWLSGCCVSVEACTCPLTIITTHLLLLLNRAFSFSVSFCASFSAVSLCASFSASARSTTSGGETTTATACALSWCHVHVRSFRNKK